MSDYQSNYGVNQLTPEFLSSLTTSDCFGPSISNGGKYYVTTLKPNVDILSIPERLSNDPSSENYFGKYYGVSLVLDQTTSTDDAQKLVNSAYGKWCDAYDSNYTIPYQIDKSPDEVNRYISEVESTIGTTVERFEMGDSQPTIWYRDKDGNLVDQAVEIKLNNNTSKQLKEIQEHYQEVYGNDKKVEIKKNDDGSYSLTVDGKETKKFSLNKYDMTSLENSNSSNKVKSSDKLTDDNKMYLESYYKESYKDQDVKIEKNKDGTYSLLIGEERVDFKKGTTIAEAIAQANEELNGGKTPKTPNQGQNTNRLNDLTGQGYRIYINVNDFEEIQSSHNMAKGILESSSGLYRTDMFTEKLAEAYSSLVSANEDPTEKITKASELLSNVVTNVHYSLEAYKNIDHDLGIVINSVIEEIFNVNSYDNKHGELSGLSQNEKESKIKEMINFLDTNIKDLEEEYRKNYDNGFGAPLSESFAQFLVGLADAFSIDSTQSDVKYYPDQDRYMNDGTVRLDFDQIETTINFIKEHDVVNKLGSYVGTKDQGAKVAHEAWEQSGMADLNEYILKYSNVSDYSNEQKNDYAERLFLTKFIRNQGEFKEQFSNKYGSDPVNFLLDDGLIGNNDPDSYYVTRRDLINDIKGLISTNLSAKMSVKTWEVDDKTHENIVKDFDVFELADYYTSDGFKKAKQELNDSILDIRNTKYNYERYLEVLPYLGEKDDPKYLEYLTKDYSKYDLLYTDIGGKVQFLNQEEIALYMMLKETGKEDKASGYLDAMSDMIAQREGFQLAAERIYEMNKNGEDIWDFISTGGNGFTDGLEGFFRNIGNCFYSDGKRDAVDYRNMYMVSLLSDSNIYNDKLSPEYRDILKRNYNVMSSVGQMLIPAMSRFIPYVGWAASPAFLAMSTFGGSVESAKQMGKSDVQAYLYGGFQTCSTMVLYKLMSGIPGIGNGKIPNGWMDYASNVSKAAERAIISTYVDATLRKTILQEDVDFSNLPSTAFDSAINAMFVSTIMQGGTKLTFKIADGITLKLGGGEYSSYQDFLADTEAQFKATPMGQRLLTLYRMNPEQYKTYRGHVSHGLVDRLVEEMSKNDKSQIPWDLTSESERIIGKSLPTNGSTRLVFDPNSNNYYLINASDGSGMTIPSSFISNHEPGPIQYTVPLAGLYSGTNISESSFTRDDVLPSVYNPSNTVPNSEVTPEVVTLKTNAEVPVVSQEESSVIPASDVSDNNLEITQLHDIETPKQNDASGVSQSDRFNINDMPLSSSEDLRKIQEKVLRGEPLKVFEMIKVGRDPTIKEIDGYECLPDHAYRAISAKDYLEYMHQGFVGNPNKVDFEEYPDGTSNNGGVDWYLGGASTRYGNVIIEAPADKKYFVTSRDGGNGMSSDPTIKHIKSSNGENAVPFSAIKVVAGQEYIDQLMEKRSMSLAGLPPEEVLEIKLGDMEDNPLAQKYGKQISANGLKVTKEIGEDILEVCESYQDLVNAFKKSYGTSIEEYIEKSREITPEQKQKYGEGAEALAELARSEEPGVTQILKSLERDGVRLEGLDHKFKSEDGIIRKLSDGKPVNDSLRYTFVLNDDSYYDDSLFVLYTLKNNGYDINAINNHWDKSAYKGLNVTLGTPEYGFEFEVQFHTESSYLTKEGFNHILYELARNGQVLPKFRSKAGKIMNRNQDILNNNLPDRVNLLTLSRVNDSLDTRKYTDYKDFKSDYAQQGADWFNGLPTEVQAYFKAYKDESTHTVGNYHTLNRILRGIFLGDDPSKVFPESSTSPESRESFQNYAHMTVEEFTEKSKEAAKKMISLSQGLRLKENTIIYRGVRIDAFSKYGINKGDTAEEVYEKLTKDGNFIYEDKGFMSSSPVPVGITNYKDVVFEIKTPAGTPIIDLSYINEFERETLFFPGQKLHLDGVYISKDPSVQDQIRIKFTAIPNSNTSPEDIDIDKNGEDITVLKDANSGNDSNDVVVGPMPAPSDSTSNEGNVILSDDEESGFSKIKVDGKSLELYGEAPEFDSPVEFNEYANKTLSTPDGVSKTAMAFLKMIDKQAEGSSFTDGMYYSFLNLSATDLPIEDKSKVLNLVINSSKELRESIHHAAVGEVSELLEKKYGLTAPGVAEGFCDQLLGENFVENGLNQEFDWEGFADSIEEHMGKALQNGVNNQKEPVLWSGFGNETHSKMDQEFTTISNTSIGDLNFVEAVFSNWDFDNQSYKTSDLWGHLSKVYAKNLSKTIDPNTGMPYTNIKYLYPNGIDVKESFGSLFKEVELPQIIRDGKIETITLTRTDPTTMAVLETKEISLDKVYNHYNMLSIFYNTSNYTIDNDPGINEELFDIFMKEVEGQTK